MLEFINIVGIFFVIFSIILIFGVVRKSSLSKGIKIRVVKIFTVILMLYVLAIPVVLAEIREALAVPAVLIGIGVGTFLIIFGIILGISSPDKTLRWWIGFVSIAIGAEIMLLTYFYILYRT
jgi:hypothetical protein